MKTSTISQAENTLLTLVQNGCKAPIFLWGAPGVGKSSIVQSVAQRLGIGFVDLRISQLAPSDIRGLPQVVDGTACFARPEFYPTSGEGILFLDEMNMASTVMMGICQQLVLDRRVGSHVIPDGWTIIAAGNRTEDRAAVNAMPAPVANRFIHMQVETTLDEWKSWAFRNEIHEQIIAFLSFRPELLFKFNKASMAWPSPRSWSMADTLHKLGIGVEAAVGDGATGEFNSFIKIYSKLPDIESILKGNGQKIAMPTDTSTLFAMVGAFVHRSKDADQLFSAFTWMVDKKVGKDFQVLFLHDLVKRGQADKDYMKSTVLPMFHKAVNNKDYAKLMETVSEVVSQ